MKAKFLMSSTGSRARLEVVRIRFGAANVEREEEVDEDINDLSDEYVTLKQN